MVRAPADRLFLTARSTGDAGLLRQLMVNLLGNVWKFTDCTLQARIRIGREPGATGPAAAIFVREIGLVLT